MDQILTPQLTAKYLGKAAQFFTDEPAAVSLLGEIGAGIRFVAQRKGDQVEARFFVKVKGQAGFELAETVTADLPAV